MGILLTVLSGFVAALIVPSVHRKGSAAIGWVAAALPAGLAVYLASWIPRLGDEGAIHIAYPWVPRVDVQLSFLVDGLSLFFALLVCVVGAAVFVYSGDYMKEHEHAGRFYGYMLAFMASMLGLVLADNVFALYIFFELTSIASFLLIGFDHGEETSRRAAWQALLVTTMGGFALMAGLILLGDGIGTFELSGMLESGAGITASSLYVPILLLVLVGAFTKSAQFPFYFWLPNAMSAPTPVSAYLHSAAMVKAGIYLLARFTPILGGTALWLSIVTTVGAATMLLAAYLALRYTELKLILAYSTIMALGLLTMLLGIGGESAVVACLVFVLAHGLYKATLFMVAGTLEHEAGSYDVAELGGLIRILPVPFAAAALAALSMAGILPFLGFIGKESILKSLLHTGAMPYVLAGIAVAANAALVAVAGIAAIRPFFGRRKHPADRVHAAPGGLKYAPLCLGAIGLLFGIFPQTLSHHVIGPAAAATRGAPAEEHLALWHGFTPEFFLGMASIALGVVLYLRWIRLRQSGPMRVFASWFGEGLDRGYDAAMNALKEVAAWQTRLLQYGVLRHYVAVALGAGFLLIAYTVFMRSGLAVSSVDIDIQLYEGAAAIILIGGAVAVIAVKRRFTAVLALSAVGFTIASIYLVFSAPDAAMVQLLVETLTLILVVLALIDMPEVYREPEPDRWRYRNVAIALGAGATVTFLMLAILELPFDNTVGQFYIEESAAGAGGRNVVNNILVDFRAFDTLGEITVLVVAGLSAYGLMRRREAVRSGAELRGPEEQRSDADEEAT